MAYRSLGRLARGGMGIVDLAEDEQGRRVARKRLAVTGSAAEMREARIRFERERALLRDLAHPAIVPLLEVVTEGDDLVLVMPYLAGGDLHERVRAHGPANASQVRQLADRLLPALAAAHRAGVVHRDIKPANILFDDAGRAYLADFGVAVTRDVTDGLTRPGVVLGTPGYVSPEQARGEPATPASDIASLGATLLYAATGSSPWGSGDAAGVLARTARGRPAIPHRLDPDLRDLLACMLDPVPARRPTAAELVGGPAGTTVLPRTAGPLRRRRRRRAAGVLGAAVVAAGALAIGAVATGGDGGSLAAPPRRDPTTTTCRPLPYQACGSAPAPFTDGRRCTDDHDDYDGVVENGCEAAPDELDGRPLQRRVRANLVPRDDTDRYPVELRDRLQLLCSGRVTLTITAPPGASVRLEVHDPRGELVARTASTDGIAASVGLDEPNCGGDDAGTYEARISPVGSDRSAEPYVLERSGDF